MGHPDSEVLGRRTFRYSNYFSKSFSKIYGKSVSLRRETEIKPAWFQREDSWVHYVPRIIKWWTV